MTTNIYQISDYRGRFLAQGAAKRCFCEAMRYRQQFFADELREALDSGTAKILRLETLIFGVPETAPPLGEGWDLIYSSELLSGLPVIAARQVIRYAAGRLNPGGRLLLGNVSLKAQLRDCCRVSAHGQTSRGEQELSEMTQDVAGLAKTSQAIFRDAAGLNVYLELHMPAAAETTRNLVGVARPAI